jgi:hypothetical protein
MIGNKMRGLARLVCLLCGATVLACALFAPAAEAGWLPPVDISESGEAAGNPHVVLDSEGNATAVWERWNGTDTVVESAYRPAGEGWEAPVDLSEPDLEGEVIPGANDAGSPRIAVDRNGNVTVVWERYAGSKIVVQSVDRPAGGSWTAPDDIGEVNLGPAPEPWIAVDWEGRATAVWKHGEVIETAFRPFGGEWEAPVPLSGEESFVPQAAMDARGDTTAVWMHFDGLHYVVESTYRPEGGEWEVPTPVSQPGEEGGNPHVALDASGDALVVWRGHGEEGESVRAAYRPAGGSWGSATDVSSPGEQVESLRDAVDPEGNAIVAWSGDMGKAGESGIAHAAFKPVAGPWEEPVELSSNGGNSFPSDVVFDTSGNAALVWQRWNGSSGVVQAAYRPAGEEWEPPVDLSEEGKQGMDATIVLDAPGDATAADGDATAVWVSEVGMPCGGKEGICRDDTVQAAGYDPGGVPVVEVEAPETGTVGEPIEISTPTEGLFAPLIEFGDGKSAGDTQASHEYEEPGEYQVTVGGAEVLGYRSSVTRTITISPAGPEDEPEAEEPEPIVPGAKATVPASPPAAAPGVDPPAPSQCLAAEGARVSALHRLKRIGARLRRADGVDEARRLATAKRRQIAILDRARQRVADTC